MSRRVAWRATAAIFLLAVLFAPRLETAEEGRELFNGVARVQVADGEYTIPVLCDDALQPELGFSTEPARVTRERTGRTSTSRIGLRAWEDTDMVIVTLDRYVTWIAQPASVAGVLSVETSMSPATVMRDGTPVAFTYEMWSSGDRPEGLDTMTFEVRCGIPQPATPSFRRLGQ